jgi:hypothetical protein
MEGKQRGCKKDAKHICANCSGNFCGSHSINCQACKNYICNKDWEQHKREETSKFSVKF